MNLINISKNNFKNIDIIKKGKYIKIKYIKDNKIQNIEALITSLKKKKNPIIKIIKKLNNFSYKQTIYLDSPLILSYKLKN
ncbi:hypothetical protein NASALF_079 [Candidatus Nasuia deltocephalinicola str. NAS-ALF]|uniref:Uncharacterized protein n=1 Tax=Candidatus Nasuia deltocephalinicola str. NAS-ALF TaxID=1343077 RepID=S5TEX3_9PROT|nr:hypothetical protein NASALF_079 [Candidatus Nasuia deltocephalinicola str. NAS-ALF]